MWDEEIEWELFFIVRSVEWLISISKNYLFLKTVSESLENICEKGYPQLRPYFEPIVHIVFELEKATIFGQAVENASHHLLRASAHLINGVPPNDIAPMLEKLCIRPFEYLTLVCATILMPALPFFCLFFRSIEPNPRGVRWRWTRMGTRTTRGKCCATIRCCGSIVSPPYSAFCAPGKAIPNPKPATFHGKSWTKTFGKFCLWRWTISRRWPESLNTRRVPFDSWSSQLERRRLCLFSSWLIRSNFVDYRAIDWLIHWFLDGDYLFAISALLFFVFGEYFGRWV